MGKTFIGHVKEFLERAKSLSKAKIALKQGTCKIADTFTGSLIIDFHDNLYCRVSIKDEHGKIHTIDEFHDNLKRMFNLK